MFCPACGRERPEADKFCGACGTSFEPAPPVASVPSPRVTSVTVSNVYRGKNLQIIGNVVAIIGVFVGIGSCTATPMNATGFSISVLLVLGGAVTYSVGRFEHWYHSE